MDASEVSVARRITQIAASILFCFTVAGLVFGFAALKPILLDSGVYSHLCAPGESSCKAQDTRLNFMFIVASSVTNVAALPIGAYLDMVGPKVASITGGLIFGAGCVTFSLGIVRPWLDTYLIGYILLALGAPAVFLAQFHLSNAFPSRSGLVLGAITGAFDASSLPLCFYKVAYFAFDGKPSVKTFFLAYTIIPILLIIEQLLLAPATLYIRPSPGTAASLPTPLPSEPLLTPEPEPRSRRFSSSFSRISFSNAGPHRNRRMSSAFSRISYPVPDDAEDDEVKIALLGVEGKEKDAGIVGVMFGKGVGEQIGSTWWWAMEFMVLVHMTRINWYLTTVSSQLIYYTHDIKLADRLTDAFIFLLPLGGLLSIPLIGHLLDTRPLVQVVLLMSVMGVLFGAFTLATTTIPQLIGIGMLVVFRPLFYTAISDYAAKVFGFKTFGTVYGLAMTMSGLFGLILTPLDILTKGPFGGSFTPVNVALLALGAVSSLTLAWRVYKAPQGIRLQDDGPGLSRAEAIAEEREED